MRFSEYLNESRYSHSDRVQPEDYAELRGIVKATIKEKGPNCDLNFIDTRYITSMAYLFAGLKFNGDISKWNVSNVRDMENMFDGSSFNGDISKWDVSKVKNMSNMFKGCPLEDNPKYQPKFKE